MATVISIVSYPFLPAKVGGQKGVALFYKYFSRHHKVVCVTTEKNDPTAAEGYEVMNILSNSPIRYINFFYFFTLRRIIRRIGATHLVLEHPYYGWLGVMLKWACGLKLVIHSHNLEGLRWRSLGKWWWSILWAYEKWVHRRADYNFFIQDEDREYAILHFSLEPGRCITMTYGLEMDHIPDPGKIRESRRQIRQEHGIPEEDALLFFNGAFNYRPNRDALEKIAEKINPILLQKKDFPYKILICGKDIPEAVQHAGHPNMIFAGFVEDIATYFRGADVFLNPVTEGGGIKTKLVEALGNNLTAVSVRNGAMGIDPAWCNGKLLICGDNEWEAFAELVLKASKVTADTAPIYFEHFYWGYTTLKAAEFIVGQS